MVNHSRLCETPVSEFETETLKKFETTRRKIPRKRDFETHHKRLRDRVKIFQDPRFSRNNSITQRDLRTEFLKNPEVTKC